MLDLPRRISLLPRLRLARIARTSATTLCAVGVLATSVSCKGLLSSMGKGAAFLPNSAKDVQPPTPPGSPSLQLFAGDANYHPPEGDIRARSDLKSIVANLQQSGLDFVIFTPTLKARFYEDQNAIDASVARWRDNRQFFDTIAEPKPLFIPGVEYADKKYGTVSLYFLDLPLMLSDLKAPNFRQSAPLFFYTAKAFGAVLSINTPLATPAKVVVDTDDHYATTDHSFKPFVDPSRAITAYPQEIQAAYDLTYGIQTYSVPVSIWRDQYAQDDPLVTIAATFQLLDKQILTTKRRIAPIGGSDSQNGTVHPSMFIAATSRTAHALREGLLLGRVCVRSPEPCALRVYTDDDALPQGVGASVHAKQRVEFAWRGEGELFRNGESIGSYEGRATFAAPNTCTLYRLVLEGGYSGPVYVNCPFADSEPLR